MPTKPSWGNLSTSSLHMDYEKMDTTIVFCFLLIVKIILWRECWQDKHLFFISLLGKLGVIGRMFQQKQNS